MNSLPVLFFYSPEDTDTTLPGDCWTHTKFAEDPFVQHPAARSALRLVQTFLRSCFLLSFSLTRGAGIVYFDVLRASSAKNDSLQFYCRQLIAAFFWTHCYYLNSRTVSIRICFSYKSSKTKPRLLVQRKTLLWICLRGVCQLLLTHKFSWTRN